MNARLDRQRTSPKPEKVLSLFRQSKVAGILADYCGWLAQLAQPAAGKIAFRNAQQLFRR